LLLLPSSSLVLLLLLLLLLVPCVSCWCRLHLLLLELLHGPLLLPRLLRSLTGLLLAVLAPVLRLLLLFGLAGSLLSHLRP
jgi:hypothetical protein